jgi:hypothetical protein
VPIYSIGADLLIDWAEGGFRRKYNVQERCMASRSISFEGEPSLIDPPLLAVLRSEY